MASCRIAIEAGKTRRALRDHMAQHILKRSGRCKNAERNLVLLTQSQPAKELKLKAQWLSAATKILFRA